MRGRSSASRPSSLAAALLAAATLASCGGAAEPEADAELTVYVSVPLRGPLAADGRDAAAGARLALADAGGAAAGVEVRARVLDDTAAGPGGALPDPAAAAANARAASEDSTSIAYVGELTSGATRASLPVTNEARLLQVSPGAGASDLVAPFPGSDEVPEAQPSGERSFGRVVPGDVAQAEAAADWARALGWRRVVVRSDGSALGRSLAGAFRARAGELGIELRRGDGGPAYYAGYPDGFGELTDDVVIGGRPAGIASDAFLPPYRDPRLPRLLDSAYVISAALDPSQLPPAGRELASRLRGELGREPGRWAAYGYEAMALALDSIERASDPLDREAVVEAFFATEDRGSVLGSYSIDELGETTLGRLGGYLLRPAGGTARLEPRRVLRAP